MQYFFVCPCCKVYREMSTESHASYNPVLDWWHADRRADDAVVEGAAHAGADASSPSVRLVYLDDALRVARASGGCLCLLILKGCPACERVWSTWCALCEGLSSLALPLAVHVECRLQRLQRRM